MKRILWLLAALLLLPACGSQENGVELTIFAAASMQEALTEIGESYMNDHPSIRILFNFDSSGTLKTQIQEGADCDIFISAGQRQMDQLDRTASQAVNTEGLDFLQKGTRINLLENKVALAVPEGNPAGITSYADLRTALEKGTVMLAMGNSDVPVGQYTQTILTWYGLDEEALAASGCITYGSNVKEVTTQIAEGVVDCGIIYATDAQTAGLEVVDTATEEMCGQVIYPAARLRGSTRPAEAAEFFDYLLSKESREILERYGFTPLN